ncbi:alpha/beta hydrolase [Beduini massiliensis]|uniref:alpha/beta hydrolase n=1 Tax=Beduini massiliensis TaxID=1585974 RepID=UPI00059AA555|nr:alpha/beta fold hydrolase [Beduini massiliensis]
MYYSEQNNWEKIMNYLPKEHHLKEKDLPKEELWQWHQNYVHLDIFRNPTAKAKIILFHGVGTNGRQMSTIIGGPLAKAGYEIIAVDMPLYGMTKVRQKAAVSYEDWVQLGSDYIDYELSKDNRPIFLYGLSAGGMETYHIACKNKKVHGIIGMTFLDQRNQQVRNETTNNRFWAYLGTPLARLSVKLGMGKFRMKMSVCSKMTALCNNKDCLKEMLSDQTSAGNSVPMKFIYTYMTYKPEIEAEEFAVCPILLTQPEKDRWTPLHLSQLFLNKVKYVPVTIKVLKDGSHYPIEKQALKQLQKYIIEFIERNK